MEYRKLGSSGLRVSAVSLGGWLTLGGSVDEETGRAIVRAALDAGINFIDLADVYSHGEAERFVGRLLGELERDHLVLSSKCFWPMSEDPNDRGLSRKHIVRSVERSLKNLGTDHLDLFFCHREDPEVPLDETVRALDDLVHQGKILYWGTSCWKPATLLKAHGLCGLRGLYAPIVEQPKYNLLERTIEKRLMPVARRLGMGLVVWSPLAGGLLTGKYDDGAPEGSRGATSEWLSGLMTEGTLGRTRSFSRWARDAGYDPAQLALAWILARSEISSVITGATRPEHVTTAAAAAELRLPDDVLAELDRQFPAR
jgi:aryl-alcohol dehydrogenase-like predicted oxidoreductase